MDHKNETGLIAEVNGRVRTFTFGDGHYLFRQAGGCLEIGTGDGSDLVHICTEDVDAFLEALPLFVRQTPPLY